MTKYMTPVENVNAWQAPTQEARPLEFQQFEEELGSSDALREAELRAQKPQDAYRHDILVWCHALGDRPDLMDCLDYAIEQPWEAEEDLTWD